MPFEDTTYIVELCNYGACSQKEVNVTVCEDTDEETLVREGMGETQRRLEEDNLEEALAIMVTLGEADLDCDDVEVLFFFFFLCILLSFEF